MYPVQGFPSCSLYFLNPPPPYMLHCSAMCKFSPDISPKVLALLFNIPLTTLNAAPFNMLIVAHIPNLKMLQLIHAYYILTNNRHVLKLSFIYCSI
jgi:hypothetical protein